MNTKLVSGCCRRETANKPRAPMTRALIVLILLVGTTRCAVGQQATTEEPLEKPDVPKTEHIEKMIVEAYSNPWPHLRDIRPFEVPREHYDKILEFFRHPVKTDHLASKVDSQELGTARLELGLKRSVRLCWFFTGNDPNFSFSCEGMRYRTTTKFAKDQAWALDTLIREIKKQTRKKTTREKPERD